MEYKVEVITGDRFYAGSHANVWVVLGDAEGNKSPTFKLRRFFINDFVSGAHDHFSVKVPESVHLGHVSCLEFWRDAFGFGSNWFLNGINIYDVATEEKSVFPVHKWIKSQQRYIVHEFDTCLPQHEHDRVSRMDLLEEKRQLYELAIVTPGFEINQVKKMPEDEEFSRNIKWDMLKRTFYMRAKAKMKFMFSQDWKNLYELESVYKKEFLPKPLGMDRFKDDFYFGVQRVAGSNAGLISVCNKIPEKFGVTEEMVSQFLEGKCLESAISEKKLFIVDLEMLKDMPCAEGHEVCAPMALFFEDEKKKLMPIAIQLKQEPGCENPVFVPSDPEYTWVMAKMWFNNADAQIHQAYTHLLSTHIIAESLIACTHRNLAPSHPIFRLLVPHFLYTIAINRAGMSLPLETGSYYDTCMSAGLKGIIALVNKGFQSWRMDVEGTLPVFLQEAGVLEDDVLKYYPYRDDGLLLYNIVQRYVAGIVEVFYDSPETLECDWEIQTWAQEMVKPAKEGGIGIKGVPGNGNFSSKDDLITAVTSIIFTCSVAHAATNMSQYDEYGFIPNYPSILRGKAPTDKSELTIQDVVKALPDKSRSMEIMVMTRLLSDRSTNFLGDFEVSYQLDPRAKNIVTQFRDELRDASRIIHERNETRRPSYDYLLPEEVPNSISI